MFKKARTMNFIGEGSLNQPLKSEGKKLNKRTRGFINCSSSRLSGYVSQSNPKTYGSHIGNEIKHRASLSPGNGILRVGRQTRSSSINLKQQQRSKFQKRTSRVYIKNSVNIVLFLNNHISFNKSIGVCLQ